MGGKYLLDTNIIIALFGAELEVKENLAQAEEVYLPSVAIGELFFGAHKSGQVKENLARIEELAAHSAVLGCDLETARHYGEIKHALQIQGRPLPENDIWIAAVAIQYGLSLVTRDIHFNDIGGLTLVNW
jgi:tRNA(fMet)-specific endonuclease VapC